MRSLLVLSFIEGACVMVAELAGGKMLAPFYGTSLYAWASTLAITLGGLTLGYYIGGRLSNKTHEKRRNLLFLVLAISSALVIVMPAWASFIMTRTMDMEFLSGLVLSQLSFLFLPILGFGIVSPLIIGLIGENENSGTAAGLVYAISTLGGIIATLLTGFWLVPILGISLPCIIVGALLLIASFIIIRPVKKTAALLLLVIFPSYFFYKGGKEESSDKYEILCYSEGIMGQVKVLEFQTHRKGQTVNTRNLLVNHNWQTWIDKDNPAYSFLYYTRFTNAVISGLPSGSKALLIGLGGGSIAKQFELRNLDYDAVEIDGRLPELAKQYFGLKGTGRLIVDDGRHYINKCREQYDLVIIDALLGENVPSHLLSVECFSRIKEMLKPGGKVFIEFDGIVEGDNGQAQKMLYNTLVKAGYQCTVFSSIPGEKDSDIMYLASVGNPPDVSALKIQTDPYYDFSGPMDSFKLALQHPTNEYLIDDKPELDYLLKKRMAFVRNDVLKKANKAFLENDVLFYY
jgi:predicted membrane-bound spermidine synthase